MTRPDHIDPTTGNDGGYVASVVHGGHGHRGITLFVGRLDWQELPARTPEPTTPTAPIRIPTVEALTLVPTTITPRVTVPLRHGARDSPHRTGRYA